MDCRVCGRQFDPQGFQVMVPGSKHGFDRVDCALEASPDVPPQARSIEPVQAVLRALPTAVTAVPALAAGPPGMTKAASVRPPFLAGANLALLAVGAAATIYLWLRVFGADAGPFSFPAPNTSKAFSKTTVSAAIDLSPQPVFGPEPESTIRSLLLSAPAGPAAPRATSRGDGGKVDSDRSNRSPDKSARRGRPDGPVVRPAPPPPPPAPPSEPSPTRSPPVPTDPVPSSPPDDRVPGPTLPGGSNPEQPALPGSGRP